MSGTVAGPRLTLGLPTYNGEQFLGEALDALLAQTYTDFELLVSDNGSTDRTAEIVRRYAAEDPRVRYVHHPVNRGSSFNHNLVIDQARGKFFKWVSDDDLYAPDLLQRCMEALDRRPEISLAHAWTAFIDDQGRVTDKIDYGLTTDMRDPVERFRSVLHTQGGDDIYGVIRMPVLRSVAPFGSYHWADRVFVAELALHGPFHNEPEFLYFRRDHPDRTTRVGLDVRQRCARLDPARANRWRHPMVRLLGEYVVGFVPGHPARPAEPAGPLALSPRARHVAAEPRQPDAAPRAVEQPGPRPAGRRCPVAGRPAEQPHAHGRRPHPCAPPEREHPVVTRDVRRIGLYGFLGSGNLENDASLEAVVAWLRIHHPEVELSCITIPPEAVEARYGIPSEPLAWEGRRSGRLAAGPAKVFGRLVDVFRHYRLAGSVDAVVVPGMGVLEDSLGVRPWGLPYWLFLIAIACRLRRRPFLLLAVGADRASNPVTGWLYASVVRLAKTSATATTRPPWRWPAPAPPGPRRLLPTWRSPIPRRRRRSPSPGRSSSA